MRNVMQVLRYIAEKHNLCKSTIVQMNHLVIFFNHFYTCMFKGGQTPAERAVVAMLECEVRVLCADN